MKQVGILGGMLAIAMTASYLSWTSDNRAPDGLDAVAMYSAKLGDLQKLSWKSEEITVVVERKNDAQGDYTWVTVTERKEVKPEPILPVDDAAEGEDDATGEDDKGEDIEADDTPVEEPEPVYENEVVQFAGSRSADDLWDKFEPLYALRELSVELDSATYGLDDTQATIEVVRASGAIELMMGGEAFGTKDRYVRLDTKVFLVNDSDLRSLQHGKARLVERSLVPFKAKATDAISLSVNGETVVFTQQNIDDQSAAFWERDDAPGVQDDAAGSWIDNLLRLHVAEYKATDDAPPLKLVMTYTVKSKTEAWAVEIFEETGLVSPEFYAKSQFTRSLVKLTKGQASVVIDDLDTVLSGEVEASVDDDVPADDEAAPN